MLRLKCQRRSCGREIVGRKDWNVKIKVDNKQFLAHREILADQSDFLAELLIHVSHQGVIEIKPLPPYVNGETFEKFVDYIYEGKLDIDSKNDNLFDNLLEASKNLKAKRMQEYLINEKEAQSV